MACNWIRPSQQCRQACDCVILLLVLLEKIVLNLIKLINANTSLVEDGDKRVGVLLHESRDLFNYTNGILLHQHRVPPDQYQLLVALETSAHLILAAVLVMRTTVTWFCSEECRRLVHLCKLDRQALRLAF
jgi:hypothetical protein